MRIRISTFLAALALACCSAGPVVAAPKHDGCPSAKGICHYASNRCSQTQPVWCIHYAAARFGVSFVLQRAIARCESNFNPYAYNGAPNNARPVNTSKSSGLMQFMPGTFANTYYGQRGKSIWSARWNALAGAWTLRHQGTPPWDASRACWG